MVKRKQRNSELSPSALINLGIKYAKDAAAGKGYIPDQVRGMAKIFLKDLKRQDNESFKYYFSREACERLLILDGKLKHYKGSFAGSPFYLEPWQIFIMIYTFGWLEKETNFRRFTRLYIEVPRKNGKTFLAALIGIYMLVFDGEPAAEVYCGATTKDQAKLLFKDVTAIVKKSPALSGVLEIFKTAITHEGSFSSLKAVASDADKLDGFNVHCSLLDELHQHPSSDLWNVMVTGTGSRDSPLILGITTAGSNEASFCFTQNKRSNDTALELVPLTDFLGFVFTVTDAEAYDDPKQWYIANPNLLISKSEKTIISSLNDTKASPATLNSFKRLHLNIWTNASVGYLDPSAWKLNVGPKRFTEADLKGRECYGGLDLSNTLDLSSLCLIFPPVENGEKWKILSKTYCPEATVDARSKLGVPYRHWVDEGYLTATPGKTIDHDFIIEDIKRALEDFDVKGISFDRWGSKYIRSIIDEIDPEILVSHGQGYASMNDPCKQLLKMILDESFDTNNNPVLAWSASNAVAVNDAAGNVKLDKNKSSEKIDPIIALVMAVGCSLLDDTEGEDDTYSENEVAVM